jgi:hypothetical protein
VGGTSASRTARTHLSPGDVATSSQAKAVLRQRLHFSPAETTWGPRGYLSITAATAVAIVKTKVAGRIWLRSRSSKKSSLFPCPIIMQCSPKMGRDLQSLRCVGGWP